MCGTFNQSYTFIITQIHQYAMWSLFCLLKKGAAEFAGQRASYLKILAASTWYNKYDSIQFL